MDRKGSSKCLATVFAGPRLSACKFSGQFNGLRHCMLVAMLLLVCSCSNQLESQFPTLAEHAGMDQSDFMTYLKSPVWEPKGAAEVGLNGTDAVSSTDSNSFGTLITKAGVKDMTIGAIVNTATSSYIVRPIFDLALLAQDNLLDSTNSSSESSTEINLITSKSATSDSNRLDMDYSASGSYLGFKASADYHQQNATQGAHSDGTVSVRMVYSNYNSKVNVLVSNFASSYNFSKYMVGTQLTSDQIESYVDVQYTDGAQGKYISNLIINNKGQYKDPTDPFANIQLLDEMEAKFSELAQQYEAYQADTDISQEIMGNMKLLKGYILGAIQAFYANNGDSFVTTIYAMNQAIGSGQLNFSSTSSNSESTWGAGLSASYRGLGWSAGASANVQYYKQSGWADAFSSMTVTATAAPAGIVDTNAWATQLQTMLQSQSSPISVPTVNLPSKIDVTPPDAPGQAKDPNEPPDSCFSSYDDWLNYKNKKKPGGQEQDQQDAQNAEDEMEHRGAIDLLNLDQAAAAAKLTGGSQTAALSATLYQNYRKELLALREMKRQMQGTSLKASTGSSNLVRVNNMFVSGFETTPYEMVIPQLRPNLDIPGGSDQLDGFPNVTKLLMVINELGGLNTYLTFISNYSLSQVTDDITSGYAQFYNTFSDHAFDLISTQLQQGHDITDQLLASFGVQMFGATGQETASELCQSFDDNIDMYDYIKTLLDPDNARIWTQAPGGYIPFAFDTSGNWRFVGVDSCSTPCTMLDFIMYCSNVWGNSYLSVQSPSQNPVDFYTQDTSSIQSPLYPVFIYNGSSGSTLVFLQNAGAYQIVYGYQNSYAPWPGNMQTTAFDNITPVAANWNKLFTSVADPGNSFLPGLNDRDPLIWKYSLNWPNTSQYQKYDFLLVDLGAVANRTGFAPTSNNSYYSYLDFRKFFSSYGTGEATEPLFVRDENSAEVDLLSLYPYDTHWGLMLLLPINSTSVGNRLQQYMRYTADLSATDIVQDNSFNFAYSYALTD